MKTLFPELAKIDNVDQLKKFRYGQGMGWQDAAILKENGFDVELVSNYESLFLMLSLNRFDLLCRGVNEVLGEWEKIEKYKGIALDENFIIHYEMPPILLH